MQKHRKFIGDKRFYLMVLGVAMPIMIQNGITNFVSLLDNIMVGQVGTEQMSGVAIVNQLLFIYNLCIFGGVSGAGIFTAQYFGQGNDEGVRNTFRFKLWIGVILTAAAITIFLGAHEPLIRLYLTGDQGSQDMNATLAYGISYMKVMLVGLPPFLFGQLYASTLRECGETMLPMKAGITAVFVNLVFNYILIYGKFGAPQLGVVGAAAATVLSRYVEMAIVLIRTHGNKEKYRFTKHLYRTIRVPAALTKQILIKGTPLMLNETFWAGGVAILMQCYSVRGLNVVAAMNISNTISNLFNVVFIALGDSVAIIVGQLLGAGRMEEAKDRYEADHVFRITLHCDRRADGARGSALPTPLQHDGRSTPHGGNLHRGSGHVHAGQCIPACKLLYPALRWKNDHHVPVRQRLHLGCQCAGGFLPEPFYRTFDLRNLLYGYVG